MEFFAISLGIVQEYAFELNIRIIVIADDVHSFAGMIRFRFGISVG